MVLGTTPDALQCSQVTSQLEGLVSAFNVRKCSHLQKSLVHLTQLRVAVVRF